MPYLNKQQIIGNAGKDAEIAYLQSGQAVAKFPVAVNRWKKPDEEQATTDWFNVVVFGKQAEWAGAIAKGDSVYVCGRLEFSTYKDREGVMQRSHQLVAEDVKNFGRRQRTDDEDGQSERPRRSTRDYDPGAYRPSARSRLDELGQSDDPDELPF